ncbi:MAG: metallophosphoesterase [Lachnospiraceae bacterium]|nr:metallophosphoesterase [Lachnospiraceae bacterium]MDE5781349.1 metallophosphoesterase [Lachnospiraceae bacterium]
MKVLIISDTHARDKNVEVVLEKEGNIDLLIHLGDVEGSEIYIETLADCPCEIVKGNNDYFSDLPSEKVLNIGKYKAFITHGHYYNVSVELRTIVMEGIEREADIVMFGHIHRPVLEEMHGVTVLNPGSLSLPRQSNHKPSYMVMNIDNDDNITYEIKYL